MATIQTPVGMSKGLTIRRFNPGDVCGFAHDKVALPPRKDWPALLKDPSRVRMTRYVRSVLDQNGQGSCASESSTGNFKLVRAWQHQPFVEFNPWFNFYHVRSRGGGSSLDDNLRFGREFGYCPEEVWPRSEGVRKPSDEAYQAAKPFRGDEFDEVQGEDEAGGMLLSGLPFAFGWDGHSVVAVEMIDLEWFWYLNSWKDTWGEKPYPNCPFKGFGRLRLRDIDWRYGAYSFLTTTDT